MRQALGTYAGVQWQLEMRDAAQSSLQRLLDTREETLAEAERVGDEAQQQDAQELAAEACVELASIHVERDNHGAAVPLFERALVLQQTAFGRTAAPVLATLDSLAIALSETGDSEGAEKALRAALPLKQALQGKTSQAVADCYNELSVLLQDRGDLEASEGEARAALDVYAAAGHLLSAGGVDLARLRKHVRTRPSFSTDPPPPLPRTRSCSAAIGSFSASSTSLRRLP